MYEFIIIIIIIIIIIQSWYKFNFWVKSKIIMRLYISSSLFFILK